MEPDEDTARFRASPAASEEGTEGGTAVSSSTKQKRPWEKFCSKCGDNERGRTHRTAEHKEAKSKRAEHTLKKEKPSRGKKEEESIAASLRRTSAEDAGARDADRELREDDLNQFPEDEVIFAQLMAFLDANRAAINAMLAVTQSYGWRDVNDVTRYVQGLWDLQAEGPANGLKEILVGWKGHQFRATDVLNAGLPEYYREELDVVRRTPNSYARKYMAAGFGLLGIGQGLRKKSKLIAGASAATAMALYGGYTEDTVRVRVDHAFSYVPLTPQEQVALAADRRNMSFRAAKVLESTFGVRIAHKAEIWERVPFSYTDRLGEQLGGVPLQKAANVVEDWVLRRSQTVDEWRLCEGKNLKHAEARLWCDATAAMDPRVVRTSLKTTVPGVDGLVIDLSLYHWMTTLSRFMMASDFVKADQSLRNGYSTQGQIANDLTQNTAVGIFYASRVLSLVNYMRVKHLSSTVNPDAQEWDLP